MEEFDLENPLTSFKEHQADTIPSLFANESYHMPSLNFKPGDFRASLRREAISLFLQVQYSYDYDPFIPYLAVNYMDRFISKLEIPQGKPWIVGLIVISCLSLAEKMKNTDLSLSDFQRDEIFIYDTQSVRRMEILILTTLNWRMRSITPFSFLYFFMSLFEIEDTSSSQALKRRALEIIFKTHYEIKLLEYKPSIIAASALLCASQTLFPLQCCCFRAQISSCEYVNKENLLKCLGVMQEMVVDPNESTVIAVLSSTQSVVDRQCTNTDSEKDTSNTIIPERDNIKRRKLNEFCNDHMLQLSQIQQC